MRAYRGSLDSKDELATALHAGHRQPRSIECSARRVKSAEGIDTEERRYLNIALSEIGLLRLVDAQIMADADSREDLQALARKGEIDTKELCRSIRRELARVADDEGIECRLLADDELPKSLPGSQYWVESAMLALINASLSFTDEGFIELSIWVETSMQGQPELHVPFRTRASAGLLRMAMIMRPLRCKNTQWTGCSLARKPLQSGMGQEHLIQFTHD